MRGGRETGNVALAVFRCDRARRGPGAAWCGPDAAWTQTECGREVGRNAGGMRQERGAGMRPSCGPKR